MIDPEILNRTFEVDGKMLKPDIIKSDTDNEMLQFGVETAFEAINRYAVEKEIAELIQERFESAYGQCWQCIVGKDFSVSFTHESKNFIFFSIEQLYILIFRI